MNEREELLARADKYLHGTGSPFTGSGEYASEILRDMAAFVRRTGDVAQPPEQPLGFETVTVPKAAIDWLNGEGPDADGNWFGDSEPEIKPGKPIKRYWWRSKFRSLAFPSTKLSPAAPEACADCANTGWCHANSKCYLKGAALSSTDLGGGK